MASDAANSVRSLSGGLAVEEKTQLGILDFFDQQRVVGCVGNTRRSVRVDLVAD